MISAPSHQSTKSDRNPRDRRHRRGKREKKGRKNAPGALSTFSHAASPPITSSTSFLLKCVREVICGCGFEVKGKVKVERSDEGGTTRKAELKKMKGI
jgi:hypothetical protein